MTSQSRPPQAAALLQPDLCVIGVSAEAHEIALGGMALGLSVLLAEAAGFEPRGPARLAMTALLEEGAKESAADQPARWTALRKRLVRAREEIAPNHATARFRAAGITVLEGEAAFTGPRALAIGGVAVAARRFVIARGVKPALPADEGLADMPRLSIETLLDGPAAPRRVLVLGGGADAVAAAQAFARLGADVALLVKGLLLSGEDVEVAGAIRRALRADRVEIVEGVRSWRADRKVEGLSLVVQFETGQQSFDASSIFAPEAVTPDIEGLRLDLAGVSLGPRGGVPVDANGRSRNRRIYAVGASAEGHDVRTGPLLRHAFFGLRSAPRPAVRLVCTAPPAASVGLTDTAARDAGHSDIRIARWPMAENELAQIEGRVTGFVKVVADGKGAVLGAQIVGPQAASAIAVWSLAVQRRITLDDVATLAWPAPTVGETSRRAAAALLLPRLRRPAVKLALRLSRLFG